METLIAAARNYFSEASAENLITAASRKKQQHEAVLMGVTGTYKKRAGRV